MGVLLSAEEQNWRGKPIRQPETSRVPLQDYQLIEKLARYAHDAESHVVVAASLPPNIRPVSRHHLRSKRGFP